MDFPDRTVSAVPSVRPAALDHLVPSWYDLLASPSMGYLTADLDIGRMVRAHGDCAVVIKDLRGRRHVVPASMLPRLSESAAMAISMVFVAAERAPTPQTEDVRTGLAALREALAAAGDTASQTRTQTTSSGGCGAKKLGAFVGDLSWLEGGIRALAEGRDHTFMPTFPSDHFSIDDAGEPPLPDELRALEFRRV